MKNTYDPPSTNPEINPEAGSHQPGNRSSTWVWLSLSAAVASVLYRVIFLNEKEQTAILFIGIPLALSLMLAITPTPKSTTGTIFKGITLTLLLFGILLIEGLICILMAAPLFYLIGAIIGALIGRNNTGNKKLYCSTIIVLAIMSFEGISEALSFNRAETVTIEREVNYSPEQIRSLLAQTPNFDTSKLPLFLKLGFPLPRETQGNGIALGDRRTIHFAGGEGQPGDLIVEVTDSSADQISFSLISDHSHINHWLTWKTITWTLSPSSNSGYTTITLSLSYDRDLDPAWYFGPIERYGVRKAGEFFINTLFPTE